MGAAGFGARVRQARLDLAAKRGEVVSQTDIAREIKVTGVTVGRWENGQKVPDLPMIERLAQALGVDPGWLAFGAGTATQDAPADGGRGERFKAKTKAGAAKKAERERAAKPARKKA